MKANQLKVKHVHVHRKVTVRHPVVCGFPNEGLWVWQTGGQADRRAGGIVQQAAVPLTEHYWRCEAGDGGAR